MKIYLIKSPSGQNLSILADSLYHAVQIAVGRECYKYSNVDYLKLNQ
jgi:hypothetical protein